MKKLIMFSEDEYKKIREIVCDIEEDVWDLEKSEDRSVMFHNLSNLKEALGYFD